jgi:predicted nucleic acid-binding protein
MKVLIDADALIALVKEDDTNHQRASKIAITLQDKNVFISPLTIPEVAAVISHRMGHLAAKKLLQSTRQEPFTQIDLSPQLINKADQIFLAQNKKGISWPDCLNAAIFTQYKLDAIFSFDRFYKQLRLPVLT